MWFRNDLRVLDNEALYKAWLSSETVLPVYCVDPRLFTTTYYFGFPKTGGIVINFYLLFASCFVINGSRIVLNRLLLEKKIRKNLITHVTLVQH